jgi:putative peptidoglycan lipid II flippase
LLNLLLVGQYLRKNGYSICPRLTWNYKSVFPLSSQYVPLIAAAFFVSAAVLINNAMASSLSGGSVATLCLGTKVVIFITGIVGSGVATVMVPYFSSFMARKRYTEARHNLSFFLLLVTFITIPVTVLLYLTSGDIIRLAFEGGALKSGDAVAITRVMRFGIIQLPFFTCGILIMKFAIAGKRASLVLISSFIGLSLNIVLNLLLMRHIGVAGISLATTLSMSVCTGLLLILTHRLGDVSWFDVVLLLMSWLLYLTLIICLYYSSYAGIFVVALAYVFLIGGHWRALVSSRRFVTSIA